MTSSLRSILTLLAGASILATGQGMLLALVPLRLDVMGAKITAIAAIGACYFIGFLAGAWWGDRIIHRVGHIRTYGGLIALVMVSTLALPLVPSTDAWIGLRLLHGVAAGGAFLTIESWLNAATSGRARSRVLASYMVCTLSGLGIGPFLTGVYDITTAEPFVVGGLLYAISIVPVMLSRLIAPEVETSGKVSILAVFRNSPFAVVTSIGAGIALGGYWAIGPYFAAQENLTANLTSALMATAVFSGLLLQWPSARLSDRIDRRVVVLILTSLATLAAAANLTQTADGVFVLFACFAIVGSTFCLYPLAVAHAIDHAQHTSSTLQISRGLLLANGFGLALGPFLAGQFVVVFGSRGLMAFFAAVLGGIAVMAAFRMVLRAALPNQQKEKFVFVRTTTPAGSPIDPRTD